jgi:hypothetical protein
MLPPKAAFTSPVLSTAAPAEVLPPAVRARQGGGGPVIEYVRGPMRIAMAPVASAAPSDSGSPRKGGGGGKRRHRGGGERWGGGEGRSGGGGGPSSAAERREARRAERLEKKRRRRRRRKRNQGLGVPTDGPVSFFAPTGQGRPPDNGPRPFNGGQNGGGQNGGQGGPWNPNNGQPQPVQLGPDGQPLPRKRRRRRRRGRGGRGRPDFRPGMPGMQGGAPNGNGGGPQQLEGGGPPPPALPPPAPPPPRDEGSQ